MSEAMQRYREAFDGAEESLPGARLAWLRSARLDAMAAFAQRGFPKPREEDWKYTRVAPIEKATFVSGAPATPAEPSGALLPDEVHAHQLVFVDGWYREEFSTRGAPVDGVELTSLSNALAAGGDQLARYFAEHNDRATAFDALNTAFAGNGALLRLGPGASLEAPVHLLFLSTATAQTIAHPRIIIDCGAGSKATVIEHFTSTGDAAYFNNVVTQVTLGEGARLEHYKLQREAISGFHVARMDVHQGADSEFVSHSASLGASLARHDINVTLAAPRARCTLNGLYAGRGRQHVDYHTRIDHAQPECISDQDYRGVLSGRARGVFNGQVHVHPHAQRSDARQSNRNLLLSRDAEVDTKPQLEIYANDVKCTHGATVGQLDERMVFYLRSRGIEESAARALLTYGFARDVVDRMGIPHIRDMVAESLLERLPQTEELRSMLS